MRFAHTNIAARNWKTLADFYINVFACKVKPPQRDMSGAWLDQATGLTDAKLEGVHLALPGHGENPPTLEIFSYASMHDQDDIMANFTGFTHIAFEVDDVRATLDRAMQHGARKLGEVVEKVVEHVGVLLFVYLRDPEGNIIEIQSWS